jgi:phosphatidylinositol-4,5-bisphosphate 3-kinase
VDLACRALLALRRHANFVVALFSLMLSCGIPELQTEDDISYLVERFMVDLSDTDAAAEFRRIIGAALRTKTTQLNDAAHMLVHYS